MKTIRIVLLITFFLNTIVGSSQSVVKPDKELKMALNDDGSHYLKATVTAQIWARYNESNPGSTLFGYNVPETFDIGLRRVRAQVFGKIHDKVFLYTQAGINNFTYNTARKPGIFFHDVLAEYEVTPRSIQMGMGLTAWTGFGRFSSPAIASILGYDAPLYQQSTNDVTDQFLRKLSIYAKGKISKLDYRVILSSPMSVQNSPYYKTIHTYSEFSAKPPKPQVSGYFMWQFLEEESNMIPYLAGNYLGKKKVFNIGAGFQYQSKAMWRYGDSVAGVLPKVEEDMLNYHADVFYDAPVGSNGAAFTAYSSFTHFGMGKDYIRGIGVMNPADVASSASIAGGGNAIPLIGTGNVVYFQTGYLLPKNFLCKGESQFQPYMMLTHGNFIRLNKSMDVVDLGVNYLISGNRAKLSLGIQNRPVFDAKGNLEGNRKNSAVLQFQIAI